MEKGGSKTAQWVKAHMWEGENQFNQVVLWLPHAWHGMCTQAHTYTHTDMPLTHTLNK